MTKCSRKTKARAKQRQSTYNKQDSYTHTGKQIATQSKIHTRREHVSSFLASGTRVPQPLGGLGGAGGGWADTMKPSSRAGVSRTLRLRPVAVALGVSSPRDRATAPDCKSRPASSRKDIWAGPPSQQDVARTRTTPMTPIISRYRGKKHECRDHSTPRSSNPATAQRTPTTSTWFKAPRSSRLTVKDVVGASAHNVPGHRQSPPEIE